MDDLTLELKVSGYQSLRQFDYPHMPKTFASKLHNKAVELARETQYKFISVNEAFREIKDFALQEFTQVYQCDN